MRDSFRVQVALHAHWLARLEVLEASTSQQAPPPSSLTRATLGRRFRLVHSARLELPLLDPQAGRHLGFIAAHLLDEALGVLAPYERLEVDAEREAGREGVTTTA